jgi:hypothetical protein
MIGLALLFWGLALICALIAVKPRAVWWKASAWAYRNPEANEPSDLAYGFQSLILGGAAIACVVVGFVMLGVESPEEQEQRREEAEASCDSVMSAVEEAYGEGDVEAAEAEARELGMETEIHEAPTYPGMETTIDIPSTVWVYDRDRAEGEQLLGTVGGIAGGSSTSCVG